MSWRFMLCRSSGEPVAEVLTATDRAVEYQLNGVHSCELETPVDDPITAELTPGFSRVKAYLDGALVLYASLPPTGLKFNPATNRARATFFDPRWVLRRRFRDLTFSYAAWDESDLIWDLINTENLKAVGPLGFVKRSGETWIRDFNRTTTGKLRDRTYDQAANVADLLGNLTEVIDGPDYDIAPWDGYTTQATWQDMDTVPNRIMANLRVWPVQGLDLPNVHFQYGETLATNCDNIAVEFAEVTTWARAYGADLGGYNASGHAGVPTQDGFGLLESVTTDSNISAEATLIEKAQGVIRNESTLRPILTIGNPSNEAPRAVKDYYLGDQVRVSVQKGSFGYANVKARLHNIRVQISPEGNENVTLTSVFDPAVSPPSGGPLAGVNPRWPVSV